MSISNLTLYKSRPRKNGEYMIRLNVGLGTQIRISTGLSCRLEDWDERTQMCSGKNAKYLNSLLTDLLTKADARILELRENGMLRKLSRQQLKELLSDLTLKVDDVIEEESFISLANMFEKVIATKNTRNAELFSNTLKKIEMYVDAANTKLDDINKSWLNGFYRSMDNLSVNSKAINMRNLRHVINTAIDDGFTNNYPFRNYRIPTEETPMRVLPIETLRFYLQAEIPNKYHEEHRDIFMLMFYLIGINIVDLSRLTEKNIVNGRIEYRRAKTGKLYSIKIEPEAMEIINKHRGEKHLLAPFDRYANYKDYAQHINACMRRIGPVIDKYRNGIQEMKPLCPQVTTYWARYSWATYAAELDIPKDTISEALGHEYGSKITGVYIKFSRDKIDAANRKVIDYIEKGSSQ